MRNLYRKAENLWQTLNAVRMIVSKGQLDDDDKTTIARCVENNNPSSNRQNYPNTLIGVGAVSAAWTDIEVHPVREYEQDGKTFCEQCEEEQAEFWSVYARLQEGGLECIADCSDKQTANTIRSLMYSMMQNYTPTKDTILIHVADGSIQSVFSPYPMRVLIADMDVFEGGDDADPVFETTAELKQVEEFPSIFSDTEQPTDDDKNMAEAIYLALHPKG